MSNGKGIVGKEILPSVKIEDELADILLAMRVFYKVLLVIYSIPVVVPITTLSPYSFLKK